jgi:hypothetical protein
MRDEQFGDTTFDRNASGWLKVLDDRQRNQHGSCPGRHRIKIDWKPARREDHLNRDRRNILPRDLPQESQVEAGIEPGPFQAAEVPDKFRCLAHPGIVPLHSSQFKRKIRLHGRVDPRWTALVNTPSAIHKFLG